MSQPATTQATAIDSLYAVFLAGAAFVVLLIWGLTTFAVLRYRRSHTGALPTQRRGSLGLELTWTALPLITVIVLFVLTMSTLNQVQATSATPAVNLHVVAFRWGWQFQYEGSDVQVESNGITVPEIRLPVGQAVHVTIDSADVDHSFYVPAFLFKRDAIPGQTTSFDLDIKQPGTFAGQCAEFCGTYHAQMRFVIVAVSPAEFQSWLAVQPRTSPAPLPTLLTPPPGGLASPGAATPAPAASGTP